MPGTRKLGRTTAHRNLMLRGMVTYLLEKGEIETTVTRAKEVRSLAEKMITLAKKQQPNKLAAYRKALAFITKRDVVDRLFNVVAPALENKTSGYTAIYKLGPRRGDGAEMAIVRIIGMPVANTKPAKEDKKAAKKVEAPALEG